MVIFTVYSMVGIVRNNTMIDDTHHYFGNVAFKCKLEQTYSSRVEMQRVNLWNISKLNRPMNILFNIERRRTRALPHKITSKEGTWNHKSISRHSE